MSITADLPNIRVRFEPEVLEALQREAAKNERSVASQVRYIVKDYLARHEAAEKIRKDMSREIL